MAAPEDDEEVRKRLADTNMENYGGKEHRDKQRAIAMKAAEWDGAGDDFGIQVWRINKFKVDHVPRDEYGTFFGGDSYIVLNTYEQDNAKLHNVHFWLGSETTQDEAGAAAIKTVELDDRLGDLPVQYREAEGHETKFFLDLFPTMNIMAGGHDTGFTHVEPVQYEPRLLHVHGKKKRVRATAVPLDIRSLNSTDCFILDLGTQLIQFRPPKSSMWEKRGCNEKCTAIEGERHGKVKGGKPIVEWDDEENEINLKFWEYFGGKPDSLPDTSEFAQQKAQQEEAFDAHVNVLYHFTNENGSMEVTKLQEGILNRDILQEEKDDVILVDVGRVIFLWIGSTANGEEISHAMQNAQNFLYSSGRPTWTPIQRIFDGREPACFWKAFDCERVPKDIV